MAWGALSSSSSMGLLIAERLSVTVSCIGACMRPAGKTAGEDCTGDSKRNLKRGREYFIDKFAVNSVRFVPCRVAPVLPPETLPTMF